MRRFVGRSSWAMGSQPFQSASQASRQHLQASKRAATASHASQRPRWHLRRQTAKQRATSCLGRFSQLPGPHVAFSYQRIPSLPSPVMCLTLSLYNPGISSGPNSSDERWIFISRFLLHFIFFRMRATGTVPTHRLDPSTNF